MEIVNRKARHDYDIISTYEAGIVLTGTEIKYIRDSYVIIKNGEAYLLNSHIASYEQGNRFNHEETRTRKLLLHKKEIYKLRDKLEMEGYTLIPLKVYLVKSRAKVEIGLAKGRHDYDKREAIKQRDIDREMQKKYHL